MLPAPAVSIFILLFLAFSLAFRYLVLLFVHHTDIRASDNPFVFSSLSILPLFSRSLLPSFFCLSFSLSPNFEVCTLPAHNLRQYCHAGVGRARNCQSRALPADQVYPS